MKNLGHLVAVLLLASIGAAWGQSVPMPTQPNQPANKAYANASASVSPTDPGDVVVTSIALAANILVLWLAGGLPGRAYLIRIDVLTTAGRIYEYPVSIACAGTGAAYPLPVPANPGFGGARWLTPPGLAAALDVAARLDVAVAG